MLTNEQTRIHNLRVIEVGGETAIAMQSLMNMAIKRTVANVASSDERATSSVGSLGIDIIPGEPNELRVTYIGFEHFDLVMQTGSGQYGPHWGDEPRRYFIGTCNPFNISTRPNPITIGLGESDAFWTTDQPSEARSIVLSRRLSSEVRATALGICLRKNPIDSPFNPALRYATTNAEFRKLLNKCKGGTFCVITRNNKIGIFAGAESDLTVAPVACDEQEFTDAIAAVDYDVIYNSLYRRKQSRQGVMNTLSSIGDFDISEFGIVDGKIYVIISGEDLTARLTYHTVSGIPEVEIPEITTGRRRRKPVPLPPTVVEVEPILDDNLTEEEIARLMSWRDSHIAWVESRNEPQSLSRGVWFSHYTSMLIRRGDAPDELDIEIMSKV